MVVWWHPRWRKVVAQVYWGMLFGLPNAVTSFNRWSKLAQALVRRLLACLFSMYFDDGTCQDWASAASQSQAQVAAFMSLLGSPWAPEKSQRHGPTGDFLGLMHDLAEVVKGRIVFWPREALTEKVGAILAVARKTGLPSGAASKLYGIMNFVETRMFGRVGRGGA